MEVAELVLKYIEALAWPLVTVGLVWGLRNHIQGAFTRMTRLETPAGAIEFASDAHEVRTEAEELAAASESAGPTAVGPEEEQPSRFGIFQQAWDTADASPIGALLTAWLVLEEISDKALAERGGVPQSVGGVHRPPIPVRISARLTELGLSPGALAVFEDLRQLRNRAIHGFDVVTPKAARDFVESARYVALEVYALPKTPDSGHAEDAAN
ncbi:hypothetical protein ACQF36_41495 [Streptomyces sp. Marseille-Q5077]|uniref:hypothetical protein n=1 Tax=Streptomyces sp. Marseille-Q5077 TaxID=3418995 RepID=UPI003D039526